MPKQRPNRPPEAATDASRVDWREQLFNGMASGPINQVQLPAEAITRLHGVLFDIDPALFREDVAPLPVRSSPQRFYTQVVRAWLDRHPALADAEVRDSGRGLHVIPRFADPIELASDADRARWDGIIRAVQRVLPADPDAPGITAVTRPAGSRNGKTGRVVRVLKAGRPVPVTAVTDLFAQICDRPFGTVMTILFGGARVDPCPVCGVPGTTLSGLDRVGRCYGGCGKVGLDRLYDVWLAPRRISKA